MMCGHTKSLSIKKARHPRSREWYREVQRIADSLGPKIKSQFIAAINSLSGSVSLRDVQNALDVGDLVAIENMFVGPKFTGRLNELTGTLRQAFNESAQATSAVLSSRVAIDISFDATNPLAVRAIRTYEFELIRQIDNAQRAGVQAVVRNAFVSGRSPREQAKEIKQFVGLTDGQANAVARFRENLVAEGVRADRLERMTRRRTRLALTRRATNIARTETIRASSLGQQELWRQSVENGYINAATTKRQWIVTPDDKLCPICESLDGALQPMEGDFSTTISYPRAGSKTFTMLTPPAHPQCRCAMGLVFD